jgi:Spy/CpxP family protein refolding chaperone
MTIRSLAVGLLLSATWLAAAPAPAQAGGDGVGLRFDRVLAELDLTEDQHQRVLALRSRFAEETAALTRVLYRRAAELARRLEEPSGDPQAIEALVQEVGRLKTDLLRVRVRAIRELRDALSADQQARLKVLFEESRRGAAAPPR